MDAGTRTALPWLRSRSNLWCMLVAAGCLRSILLKARRCGGCSQANSTRARIARSYKQLLGLHQPPNDLRPLYGYARSQGAFLHLYARCSHLRPVSVRMHQRTVQAHRAHERKQPQAVRLNHHSLHVQTPFLRPPTTALLPLNKGSRPHGRRPRAHHGFPPPTFTPAHAQKAAAPHDHRHPPLFRRPPL